MTTPNSTFLEQIASYVLENFPGETGDCCVVLPNRRAGLFLKKYLGELTDKPIWSPQVYSIEDFVFQMSGLQPIDGLSLQFELYNIYHEVAGEKASGFESFVGWADVVLHDFNDVDLYLADPEKVFSHISEARALATWNLGQRPLTSFEKQYIHFYQSLYKYYQKLVQRLLSQNKAYQGLAYRVAAEQLNEKISNISWKKILFVGFNALSVSEEVIIQKLLELKMAEVIWDADTYYLDDPVQEAGRFLRKNKKRFGDKGFRLTGNNLTHSPKNIHLIGVPKNIGQVKIAGDLLRKISNNSGKPDDTALVLNDESLLQPLLNAIPSEIVALNITMGMSLNKTPLFSLISQFLLMNENAVKFQRSDQPKPHFYYKDVVRFFDHPFIYKLFTENDISSGVAIYMFSKNINKVFISTDEILETEPFRTHSQRTVLAGLLEPVGHSPLLTIEKVVVLLKLLKQLFSSKPDAAEQNGKSSINLEYIFYFSTVFNRLSKLFNEFGFLNNQASFRYLFTQLVKQESIPFYGEPLHGLQVMGMLETRNLDFKNVILLSVNEDFIPAGKSQQSFIPLDIRTAYGLPAHQERSAVFAYHFYRLMQRAENIYLIYNTEAGDLGGGDKSRFISQIELELTEVNPQIVIHRKILSSPVSAIPAAIPITIQKTDLILQNLSTIAKKGFSASALNVYRNCSLQYYFKYIARIEETEELAETIEANTLGTVIHDAMQRLYEPLQKKILVAPDISEMQKKIESEIQKAFAKNFSSASIRYGKNHLIARVAESLVDKFLELEKKSILDGTSAQLLIRGLEEKIDVNLDVLVPEGSIQILLKGTIDRIDILNGLLRIIDYKSGKVEAKDLKLEEWPLLLSGKEHSKTFQLLFYCLLYKLKYPDINTAVLAGIFSFRNLNASCIPLSLPENEDFNSAMKSFTEVLSQIIFELFDPQVSFEQTSIKENCEYCPYKQVCHR